MEEMKKKWGEIEGDLGSSKILTIIKKKLVKWKCGRKNIWRDNGKRFSKCTKKKKKPQSMS